MKLIQKNLVLMIMLFLSSYNIFAQIEPPPPRDPIDIEPPPPASINQYLLIASLIGVVLIFAFFLKKNKSFKKNNINL